MEAIHKIRTLYGVGGGTTKRVFLCTGVGGWSQQSRMYAFEKTDCEYIDNYRVLSSLRIIPKTYSNQC